MTAAAQKQRNNKARNSHESNALPASQIFADKITPPVDWLAPKTQRALPIRMRNERFCHLFELSSRLARLPQVYCSWVCSESVVLRFRPQFSVTILSFSVLCLLSYTVKNISVIPWKVFADIAMLRICTSFHRAFFVWNFCDRVKWRKVFNCI